MSAGNKLGVNRVRNPKFFLNCSKQNLSALAISTTWNAVDLPRTNELLIGPRLDLTMSPARRHHLGDLLQRVKNPGFARRMIALSHLESLTEHELQCATGQRSASRPAPLSPSGARW